MANSQSFVLITKDSNMEGLASDGVLGLAFNSLSEYHPTLIETLKYQGEIEVAVFSLYFDSVNGPETKSRLIIGGSEPEKYAIGEKRVISISPGYGVWLCNATKAGFGDEEFELNAYAVLDTGTSFILGPESEISAIINILISNYECQLYDALVLCQCEEDNMKTYPWFRLEISNEVYVVSPKNYMHREGNICFLLIGYSEELFWVLGLPLFREYYSVYDMENKLVLMYGVEGDYYISDSHYYLLTGVCMVVTGILIYMCICTGESKIPSHSD